MNLSRDAELFLEEIQKNSRGLSGVSMLIFPYISHNDIPHGESALIIGIIALDTF